MITMGQLRKLQEIKLWKQLPDDATYEDIIELRIQASLLGSE